VLNVCRSDCMLSAPAPPGRPATTADWRRPPPAGGPPTTAEARRAAPPPTTTLVRRRGVAIGPTLPVTRVRRQQAAAGLAAEAQRASSCACYDISGWRRPTVDPPSPSGCALGVGRPVGL